MHTDVWLEGKIPFFHERDSKESEIREFSDSYYQDYSVEELGQEFGKLLRDMESAAGNHQSDPERFFDTYIEIRMKIEALDRAMDERYNHDEVRKMEEQGKCWGEEGWNRCQGRESYRLLLK